MAHSGVTSSDASLSAADLAMVKAFGPWPARAVNDASNRYSGNESAIALGRKLFFDPRLSKSGSASCASCHNPDQHFADRLPRPTGTVKLDRNSLALANLSQHRWFGWDGQADTLWGQSIRPLLSDAEMSMTPKLVVSRFTEHADLLDAYQKVFESTPPDDVAANDARAVVVNVAKALAAWQETIVTPRTTFDQFRDAVTDNPQSDVAFYPPGARRGLSLFMGRANCASCHFGPNFTNGEFANIGRPHFVEDGRVDPGRFGGLQKLKDNPYTRVGKFSDETSDSSRLAPAAFVINSHATWGQFRVPSLRNVSNTAPYMHDGSLATLKSVVDYYNEPDMERIHSAGVQLVRPMNLSDREKRDLLDFLNTL